MHNPNGPNEDAYWAGLGPEDMEPEGDYVGIGRDGPTPRRKWMPEKLNISPDMARRGYKGERPLSAPCDLIAILVPDTLPRNSCNRHDDCRAADEAARAKGATFGASHCHDECCEDCFGC
jgi:hypothetical protein